MKNDFSFIEIDLGSEDLSAAKPIEKIDLQAEFEKNFRKESDPDFEILDMQQNDNLDKFNKKESDNLDKFNKEESDNLHKFKGDLNKKINFKQKNFEKKTKSNNKKENDLSNSFSDGIIEDSFKKKNNPLSYKSK